jgi:hypothetical protein
VIRPNAASVCALILRPKIASSASAASGRSRSIDSSISDQRSAGMPAR